MDMDAINSKLRRSLDRVLAREYIRKRDTHRSMCVFPIDKRTCLYYIMNMSGSHSPTSIIGYIRVSTEDQKLGPEAQAEALKSWCSRHNAELVAVFSDLGVSGGAPLEKRTELLKAVDALKESKADGLLVAKRDRIARDVMIAAMIERLVERAGAKVISADGTGNGDTPEAQLMRNMISAFADYERALIRARTKAALAVKKSRGERTGQIPYGHARP